MAMAAGETPRDELVRGLERGLLVTRFHYTNPVHPKLAIVTGMTRDGTFYVEDGEIVGRSGTSASPRATSRRSPRRARSSRERRTLKGDFGGVARARDPRRQLELHGRHGALTEDRMNDGWACANCRSLNERRASRCYRCRTPRDVGSVAPAEMPTVGPTAAPQPKGAVPELAFGRSSRAA
jgi:hypothetical protein